MAKSDIEPLVSAAEKIGAIGSPSSTGELSLDILGTAVCKKLIGELAFFKFPQDGLSHYALGQITEVQLRNIWLEDATMRSLARQRGQVNPVSGAQDTHLGNMTVSAVFKNNMEKYEPSILGTVPATGTPIHLVSDPILSTLLEKYGQEIFYLGHVYGSTPRLPLWFKHFDMGVNGAGEAYHIGIFGKTGSGKSVLAKMMLLAYARYPKMALLVIDPQGEFAKDMQNKSSSDGFRLPLKKITGDLGKKSVILTIKSLVLDRWELFEQILFESLFFERLTVPKGENRELACSILADKMRKNNVLLKDLNKRESFDKAWKLLKDERVQKVFYRADAPRARFAATIDEADKNEFFNEYWAPVTELFREDRENARSVDKALSWLLNPDVETRPILIVDLSKEQAKGMFWNDKIQSLVVKRLLNGLNQVAEDYYKDGRNLNALVIIDEAHRLAPRELPTDDDAARGVRRVLVDAARTTRKYGLGWMFISQTLSSLDREIIGQMRIFFFGFGLALGTEFMALKELVGGDTNALKLYQSFRDPHSAIDIASRQYSFMTVGPVSPLSFSGTPLFLTAFNTPDEFLTINNWSSLQQKTR
jgi:hypothetical protein